MKKEEKIKIKIELLKIDLDYLRNSFFSILSLYATSLAALASLVIGCVVIGLTVYVEFREIIILYLAGSILLISVLVALFLFITLLKKFKQMQRETTILKLSMFSLYKELLGSELIIHRDKILLSNLIKNNNWVKNIP